MHKTLIIIVCSRWDEHLRAVWFPSYHTALGFFFTFRPSKSGSGLRDRCRENIDKETHHELLKWDVCLSTVSFCEVLKQHGVLHTLVPFGLIAVKHKCTGSTVSSCESSRGIVVEVEREDLLVHHFISISWRGQLCHCLASWLLDCFTAVL